MGKHIIKYNPDTFTFEKVKKTTKDILKMIFSHLGVGIIVGVTISFIAIRHIDSPKEKMLKHEIIQYKDQLEVMNDKLNEIDTVLTDIENRDDDVYRIIFETDPVSKDVRQGGRGGSARYSQFEGLTYGQLLKNTSEKIDALSNRTNTQARSLNEIYKLAVNRQKMLACIPAIKPLREKETNYIASYFGYRIDPVYKVSKFHEGIDFSASVGTEIIATGDGVVSEAYKDGKGDGYGKYIVINHGYSYSSLYAHMSSVNVKQGQKIKRGQVIGYVGNSGKSTGPHIHYEVRKNGKPIDPVNYFFSDITPNEYESLIASSTKSGQSMD